MYVVKDRYVTSIKDTYPYKAKQTLNDQTLIV